MRFSIIVPVYNTEKYLRECIESVLAQHITEWELIIVDDGSKDNSGIIADAYAKQDSRIRVFHKENGGQSSARNFGLDRMTGEYVAFVDSDDWVEPDTYLHLYGLIEGYHAQIACCGTEKDFPDGTISYFNPHYPQETDIKVFDRKEALFERFENARITYSPCDKLYHRDVFIGLRMTEGQIYEDMEILPKWVERAETVIYDPTPKYHYIMTETSTIRGTYNLRRMREVDVVFARAEDYKVRYPEFYDEAMARYISTCLCVISLSRGVEECSARRKEIIKQLRGDLPASSVAALRKTEKIRLAVLRLSPFVYDVLTSLLERFKSGK